MPVVKSQYRGNKVLVTAITNTSVLLSDLNANGSENTVSFGVSRIWWSTPNTTAGIKLARGANTLLTVTGSGTWDFEVGNSLLQDPAANLVITIPDGVSTCVVELHKKWNAVP